MCSTPVVFGPTNSSTFLSGYTFRCNVLLRGSPIFVEEEKRRPHHRNSVLVELPLQRLRLRSVNAFNGRLQKQKEAGGAPLSTCVTPLLRTLFKLVNMMFIASHHKTHQATLRVHLSYRNTSALRTQPFEHRTHSSGHQLQNLCSSEAAVNVVVMLHLEYAVEFLRGEVNYTFSNSC